MWTETEDMKILNAYSGLGGNRILWGSEHSITSIEINPKIADIYHSRFPGDEIVIGDAHEYIQKHHKDFDFIWSSPPCQSHSSFRYNIGVRYRGVEPKYPDMTLYEEILFLQHHAKGMYVVENVRPYYEPLIKPTAILQRHYFWSNFPIATKDFPKDEKIRYAQIPQLSARYGFDLRGYKLPNKRQVLRNCVSPELGEYILEEAKQV